tara:strand:+ start:569 stop:997 length:429 start_codon:yes stop_codon:yes gene_type:complete
MGYWPLRIGDGGINWGIGPDNPPAEEIVPGIKPEHSLLWGDSLADKMEEELERLKNEMHKEFIIRIGREMYPIEFLNGLAFSLGGAFMENSYNDSENFQLHVAVVPTNDNTSMGNKDKRILDELIRSGLLDEETLEQVKSNL